MYKTSFNAAQLNTQQVCDASTSLTSLTSRDALPDALLAGGGVLTSDPEGAITSCGGGSGATGEGRCS